MIVVIFDLDDTLVSTRFRVPRQTYHMLNRFRKLDYRIGIISFNPLASFACAATKLSTYASAIAYGDIARDLLFMQCLTRIIGEQDANALASCTLQSGNNDSPHRIYYCDDRDDNLRCVAQRFPSVTPWHCDDVERLYQFKFIAS